MDDNAQFPTRRADVVVREIEGETLVLDGLSGKVHQFNPTAGFIWACCDGESSVGDITNRLAIEYGVMSASVALDVANTIGKLQELGLLLNSGRSNYQNEGKCHD